MVIELNATVWTRRHEVQRAGVQAEGADLLHSLKATVNLVFQKTGEIRQKEIYLGDIPP